MADDKRSPERVGKPLEFGEVIISEAIFAQYMKEALDEGFRAGIEAAAKLLSDKGCGSSFCLHPGAIRALAKKVPK